MSYKLLKQGFVRRLVDGATIPPTTDNMDWREYQKWLAAGNVPTPADPDPVPTAAEVKLTADTAAVKQTAQILAFLEMSPAEIDTYLTTNITGANAASVTAIRTVLSTLGKVVAVLARAQMKQ